MDNSQASSSILDTLRTVEFRLGLKGYNVDEVDEYLDKAAQEAEGLQEHVRQLNERLRQASERIAQLEREKKAAPVAAVESEEGVAAAAAAAAAAAEANALSDETLQRTLLLAQKFVDQTKRESEAEAAAVIAQAEDTARAAIAAGWNTVGNLLRIALGGICLPSGNILAGVDRDQTSLGIDAANYIYGASEPATMITEVDIP